MNNGRSPNGKRKMPNMAALDQALQHALRSGNVDRALVMLDFKGPVAPELRERAERRAQALRDNHDACGARDPKARYTARFIMSGARLARNARERNPQGGPCRFERNLIRAAMAARDLYWERVSLRQHMEDNGFDPLIDHDEYFRECQARVSDSAIVAKQKEYDAALLDLPERFVDQGSYHLMAVTALVEASGALFMLPPADAERE